MKFRKAKDGDDFSQPKIILAAISAGIFWCGQKKYSQSGNFEVQRRVLPISIPFVYGIIRSFFPTFVCSW
jgi:hypothetical protein